MCILPQICPFSDTISHVSVGALKVGPLLNRAEKVMIGKLSRFHVSGQLNGRANPTQNVSQFPLVPADPWMVIIAGW